MFVSENVMHKQVQPCPVRVNSICVHEEKLIVKVWNNSKKEKIQEKRNMFKKKIQENWKNSKKKKNFKKNKKLGERKNFKKDEKHQIK